MAGELGWLRSHPSSHLRDDVCLILVSTVIVIIPGGAVFFGTPPLEIL